MTGSVRVDAWLWAVRVYKTRSAATTACRAGHVRVGGERAKAAQPVRVGDELRIRIAGFDRILVVRQLLTKRVSAPLAALAAGRFGRQAARGVRSGRVPVARAALLLAGASLGAVRQTNSPS